MTPPLEWRLRGRTLTFDRRPLVMGILNVTPDSFSDGGTLATAADAVARGVALVEAGADLLDIGGESTRPGSLPVPADEELRRVLPVVAGLAPRVAVPLSVDTSKASVAGPCLAAGAAAVNDVTGLRGDPDMAAVVRDSGAGVVVMHMLGTPPTMQTDPAYADVVGEVGAFFQERLHFLGRQGIPPERIILDPGIGFGKTLDHNLELLARLAEFGRLGRPVCLGVSRKGFIGKVLGREVGDRLAGSLAVACLAACRGSAQMLRVHDVRETADAVRLVEAVDARGERTARKSGNDSPTDPPTEGSGR